MATKTIVVCDFCKKDIVQPGWEFAPAKVKISIPTCGENVIPIEGDACYECRTTLEKAVRAKILELVNICKP